MFISSPTALKFPSETYFSPVFEMLLIVSMIGSMMTGYVSFSSATFETRRRVDENLRVLPITTDVSGKSDLVLSGILTMPPNVETKVSVGLALP